jgi:hypothetical protein
MNLDIASLGRTIDSLNDVFFYARSVPERERLAAAEWIASRQGLPGSYTGMFAPTAEDFAGGIRLFTGERMTSRAGTSHILGEESVRALVMLGGDAEAIQIGSRAMIERLKLSLDRTPHYCCGPCSLSLWRNIASGGFPELRPVLGDALGFLRSIRTDDGKWKSYPFFSTLYTLLEFDLPEATDELRHAAGVCERAVRRVPREDTYAKRRRDVIERVLGRV